MGAWGTAITSDDTVNDVIDCMVQCLKNNENLEQATEKALQSFRESLRDFDEAPLIWLGIAHTQWKYGSVTKTVLQHVQEDIENENGLDLWREDTKQLQKRIEVLKNFLSKISEPNLKPAAIPKIVRRPAPFAYGDCLSVLTKDSRYTAAIVLAVNNKNIEYGTNLVGALDYLSDQPPTADVFEKRGWLTLNHGHWKVERDLSWIGPARFKTEKNRLTVVCQTRIRFFDPKKSDFHTAWSMLGQQILLCRAEA